MLEERPLSVFPCVSNFLRVVYHMHSKKKGIVRACRLLHATFHPFAHFSTLYSSLITGNCAIGDCATTQNYALAERDVEVAVLQLIGEDVDVAEEDAAAAHAAHLRRRIRLIFVYIYFRSILF